MSAPPWTPEEALDLCRAHVEGGEFNGLFLAGMTDSNAVIPCIEHPQTTIAMMGLQVMSGKMNHPEWMIFLSDTYHIVLSEDEVRTDYPASLEEAFQAGDQRVSEAVVAMCVCPDGPSYQAMQLYVRDGDEIEWGEITITHDQSQMGGHIYELMLAVIATPFGAMPGAADSAGIGMGRVML